MTFQNNFLLLLFYTTTTTICNTSFWVNIFAIHKVSSKGFMHGAGVS
jgi:hypothetical protein